MGRYKVDLEQLLAAIGDMGRLDGQIEDWLAEVDRLIANLHVTWTGDAAAAQRGAHERWMRGAQGMRDALVELRQAAHRAHGNYSGAVGTNTRMWPPT